MPIVRSLDSDMKSDDSQQGVAFRGWTLDSVTLFGRSFFTRRSQVGFGSSWPGVGHWGPDVTRNAGYFWARGVPSGAGGGQVAACRSSLGPGLT